MADFNVSPYYDDFLAAGSDGKAPKDKYYRILFRPSVAIQAREMTQLQTILQQQVSNVGDHLFKEGSMIIPGGTALDLEYGFIKVNASYNSADVESYRTNFEGITITGQTNGVTAKVVGTTAATGSDALTLFVKYTNSGTANTQKEFVPGEVVTGVDSGNVTRGAEIGSASTDVGFGSAVSIQPGVYYVNGIFAFVTSQTLVLDKYSNTPSYRVGLNIAETFATTTEDTSLNDNAAGSPNFAAPGAHRYKIDLTLAKFTTAQTTDANFIELLRVENGVIKKHVRSTEYSILEETLARRTYDESGNYTVTPFNIDVREHLASGNNRGIFSAADGGNAAKLAVGLEPGKAYVRGYEIDTLQTKYVAVDKARDTEQIVNAVTAFQLGNYSLISPTSGVAMNLPNVNQFEKINIIDGSSATVGTARVRAIELHSGTQGSGTEQYKLYIFDLQMNSGKTFKGDAEKFLTTGGSTGSDFSGDFVQASSQAQLFETGANNLLYKMPFDAIKTIRTDSNAIDTTMTVRRVLTMTTTNGVANATLGAGSNEVFQSPITANDYYIADANSGTVYNAAASGAVSVTTGGGSAGNINIEVDLTGQGVSGTATLTVVATVIKSLAEEAQKTLNSGQEINKTTSGTATATTISLGKADIYRVTAVHMAADFSTNATTSDVNIIDRYTVDNGQRDNFYAIGSITRKPGALAPTGRIKIVFDFFSASAGDYFSVDSYDGAVAYEDIPSYNLSTGSTVQLRDVLDFRPRLDNTGANFTGTGALAIETPKIASNIISDFQFYLPRTDKIFLDPNGNFKVIKGVSSQTPPTPADSSDGMTLYTVFLNAYTFDTDDVRVQFRDNKRFTMRDIGRLEDRITNLEYYTSLSLLEKEAADEQIIDANNVDRFKNGFVVDPFYGHNVGDVSDPDYRTSIDGTNGEARPQFYEGNTNFTLTAADSSNYQITGDVLSLPYTNTTIIEQPFASGHENVNPYDVFAWIGQIDLTPESDEWKDTDTRPELIIDNEGLFDVVNNLSNDDGVFGTVWNEWQTQWTGTENTAFGATQRQGRRLFQNTITTRVEGQQRTGTRARIAPGTVQTNIGERVVDVNFAPFIRSRRIKFHATRMKPNTRVFPFFDGIDVSAFCREITESNFTRFSTNPVDPEPNASATAHPDGSGNLITDAAGELFGEFYIPNTSSVRFRTGQRNFKLVDDANDTDANITTSAQAQYSAQGLINTTQEVSLRSPRLTQESVQESQTNTQVTGTGQRTVGWVDPLAQTFIVDNQEGAFITKVGIFFKKKDANIPITLQIRTVDNGYPTTEIIPLGEVVKPAADVTVSADASSVTEFTFPAPIYLRANVEYAICLLANSIEYEAYIAELGQNSLGTTRRISSAPYAGVLFKSQNGSTWSADQTKDLKFQISRAVFNTSVANECIFHNTAIPVRQLEASPLITTNASNNVTVEHKNHGMPTGSSVTIAGAATVGGLTTSQLNATHTISGVEQDRYTITVSGSAATGDAQGGGLAVTATENKMFDSMYPIVREINLPGTSTTYGIKLLNGKSIAGNESAYGGTPTAYTAFIPNENYFFDTPKMIASAINETNNNSGNKSGIMRVAMTSSSDFLSPMIDLERFSLVNVNNRIDKPIASGTGGNVVQNYLAETAATGGSVLAKYITRRINLDQDSQAIRVMFTANQPSGSEIEVYYRTQESSSDVDFGTLTYTQASLDTTVATSDDPTVFRDYSFTINNISPNFTTFQIKIVMKSQQSTKVPRIRNFRAIALGT